MHKSKLLYRMCLEVSIPELCDQRVVYRILIRCTAEYTDEQKNVFR